MDKTAILAPTTVAGWLAIEARLTAEPMKWFSVKDLTMIGMETGLIEKTAQNLVYRLSGTGVLRGEGPRGKRKFRLADGYLVAVVVSSRTG